MRPLVAVWLLSNHRRLVRTKLFLCALSIDRQRTLRELEVGRTLFQEGGRWLIKHQARASSIFPPMLMLSSTLRQPLVCPLILPNTRCTLFLWCTAPREVRHQYECAWDTCRHGSASWLPTASEKEHACWRRVEH